MAKGDATSPGGIGLGYNPGGPNIGGMATFGSMRPPVSPMPNVPVGNAPGGVGPSQEAMGQMPYKPQPMPNTATGDTINQGGAGGNYKPMPMPNRAEGPMIGPGFNPMEGIMRMLNARTQGTPTSPPMQPNNYALNPSANLFNRN